MTKSVGKMNFQWQYKEGTSPRTEKLKDKKKALLQR
ncbi:hypothetical protein VCA_002678 [Vibrio albensis VL426]|nr:hypothetical protein VCA_002678 [Vibrio cholerae VL426]